MNLEKINNNFENVKNNNIEKEKFEPQIIFDFVRHGEAVYGPELKKKLEKIGYEWNKLLPTSPSSEKYIGEIEGLEGKLTLKGEYQVREAISNLVRKIDKDNERLMVISGPRFRTLDTSKIILEELEKGSIDVFKARQHKDLIDMKKHWISVLEFVKKEVPDTEQPIQYWLNMSEEELQEADLEGLEDINKRMDHFIQLIKRYVRRYKDRLGLQTKKLRVISPTHDINILSILKKEGISPEQAGLIKNAQIIEIGVDKEGENKILS